MREQGPSVEILISVAAFPAVSGSPCGIAAREQRMSGRAEPHHIEQQRLIVAFPAVLEEAAFGLPAVRDRCALILRPLPIDAAIERIGEGADFMLVGGVRTKIRSRRQRTCQQKGAIYCRQFALPGAPAGPHVEKMIVEALVAGRVRLGALRAVPEEAERRERSVYRCSARHESAGDSHRVGRQREAGGGNAGGPIRRSLVDDQPVGGIRLMKKVAEGFPLKLLQLVIDAELLAAHGLAGFGRGRESLAGSIWHWHRRRLPFHDDGSVVVERIFTTSARSCSCRAMEIDEPATSRLTSRTLTRSPTSSYCSGVPASTLARSHFALIASVSQMFSKLNRPDRSWSAIHAMASHRARRARFSLPSFWAARIACANTPRMRWCSGCLDRLDAKVA